MQIKLDIDIPDIPSEITVSGTDKKIPIYELTDEELTQIGKEWTEHLISHAVDLNASKDLGESHGCPFNYPKPDGSTF